MDDTLEEVGKQHLPSPASIVASRMHPFNDPAFHIRWSTLIPAAVEPDIQVGLADAKAAIAAICAQNLSALTYENTILALENAAQTLNRAWGRLQHLDSVADEPEQRAALNRVLPEVSSFYSSITLNQELWNVIKAFANSANVEQLSPIRRRHTEETVLDFLHSGADLPPEQKNRIAEIDARLSQLTQQYGEHVLDSTNAWEIVITDEAKLAGLPDSALAAAAANARSKGFGSDDSPAWRFSLQQPSMSPVMQHADDDELRKNIWHAAANVAAQGEFDNSALVAEILDLRYEKATILGHKNFADLTTQRRMAKNGAAALSFVEDLHQRISGQFHREYRELCAYKAEKTATPCETIEPWEFSYWAEKRRKEQFDFDDEILRPYFPVDRVMSGMFQLCSNLFHIDIRQIPTTFAEKGSAAPASEHPETWHPEVTFYELLDQSSGEHLGSFYADWHPRESKRGGAWMNQLETGSPPTATTPRQPHLGLITGNMSPPVDGKTALLTHYEVETIFHEFGHLLHGLLGNVEVKSLSGTNVPWDFVELPSQIMENFCWARESLDFFARHHETNEPIPEPIYQKMIAAKNYMSATTCMAQLAHGKLDLELHIHWQNHRGTDLDTLERSILADYRAPRKTIAPGMIRRFNHLFSAPTGYAAGYYSYKWAEVLDADAFTRFEQEGLTNPTTGMAFREHILSKGNSEPVDDLYRRFMGRDPSLEPLLKRSGLIDDPLLA